MAAPSDCEMWVPHAEFLKKYFNLCVLEWVERGYVNNMPFEEVKDENDIPTFWGDENSHATHCANLFTKRCHLLRKVWMARETQKWIFVDSEMVKEDW